MKNKIATPAKILKNKLLLIIMKKSYIILINYKG